MPRPALIATLPPYVEHRAAIAAHPLVDELRFNTVSPLAEPREDLLARLQRESGGKRLWIDLKGRQLRIARFAYLPYAYAELNHRIRVDVPTELRFRDGTARVEAVVDGNKLILSGRPGRVLGEGEPVNILDPSLRVEDPLPERDQAYIRAAAGLGLHDYMLSFTESYADVARLRKLDPKAQVVAKIESQRGLRFVTRLQPRADRRLRLMAARDDLYAEIGDDKTAILPALADILAVDPSAIVASRLLESLLAGPEPSLGDLSDLRLMETLGYRAFLLGDSLCFHAEVFRRAMAVLEQLWRRRRR